MSMIEDIRYLNETLGYSREQIDKIIGFESATTAPAKEVKTESEQKVDPQGITLESLGVKQSETTEKVDESSKESSTELLGIIKSLQEQIQSMAQVTNQRFDNLQKAQQATNTQKPVTATLVDFSAEDMINEFGSHI